MMMFVDDKKLWVKICKETDALPLQTYLDKLCNWSRKWLLQFNPAQCKVTHIGHELNTKYYMAESTNYVEVQCVHKEIDLGVFLTSDLKSSRQCIKSAARARSILGLIRRHFRWLDEDGFPLVCKTHGQPHYEYCIPRTKNNFSFRGIRIKRNFFTLFYLLLSDSQNYRLVSSGNGQLSTHTRAILLWVQTEGLPGTARYELLFHDFGSQKLKCTFLEIQEHKNSTLSTRVETYKIMSGKEKVSSQQFFLSQSNGYFTR